jgi:hypothetical protein
VERGLKGRHQLLELLQGHAGQIQERCGAGLYLGAPSTSHGMCLLSLDCSFRGASYHKSV